MQVVEDKGGEQKKEEVVDLMDDDADVSSIPQA